MTGGTVVALRLDQQMSLQLLASWPAQAKAETVQAADPQLFLRHVLRCRMALVLCCGVVREPGFIHLHLNSPRCNTSLAPTAKACFPLL